MSEQVGWRGFLNALKTEAPNYATLLPQLPRLLHQSLNEKSELQLTKAIHELINRQNRIQLQINLIALVVLCGLIALYFIRG